MSKRLIYEEDALANLQKDRFVIGQIDMIHSKSAIKSAIKRAPTVDPLEALGIGYCEDCVYASKLPTYDSDYTCVTWGSKCDAYEFCSRFKRRIV